MFGHFNKFAFILTEQHLQMFSNNQWAEIICNTETACIFDLIILGAKMIQYIWTRKGTMCGYLT